MAVISANIQVIKTPKSGGGVTYKIVFWPDPKDPQPTIYHHVGDSARDETLPRKVQWNLVAADGTNVNPIDADKVVLILPKAYNSRIFFDRAVPTTQEEYQLDNNQTSILPPEPVRGPGQYYSTLGWYYEIVLVGQNQQDQIVSFPPKTSNRGYVDAY